MSRKRQAETAASLNAAIQAEGKSLFTVAPGLAPNQLPLPQLAEKIIATLAEATAHDGKAKEQHALANDKRLAAGRMLLEARGRVSSTPGQWEYWLRKNIKRSLSDCRALIALAEAPEPEKARETEKTRAREGMARTRAARRVTAPVAINPSTNAVTSAAVTALNSAAPHPDQKVWDQASVVATPPALGFLTEGALLDMPVPHCTRDAKALYRALIPLYKEVKRALEMCERGHKSKDIELIRQSDDIARNAWAAYDNQKGC